MGSEMCIRDSQIVRPALAALAMACVVLTVARWLPESDVIVILAMEVAVGAIVYISVLLVAWMAAGRPDGPEADAVQALRRTVVKA